MFCVVLVTSSRKSVSENIQTSEADFIGGYSS